MSNEKRKEQTYRVGKINFHVTPVYKDRDDNGETIFSILLKLMKSDVEHG